MKKMIAGLAAVLVLGGMLAGCANDEIVDYNEEGNEGTVPVSGEPTAYNPLTGEYNMYTDGEGQRPVAVSVNNISTSWPQYGIAAADIIYELETEGGITRLLCLYSDVRQVRKIGSVRSLRDPFIEMVYPFDALIVHIGTSVYADEAIATYNYRTLDAGAYSAVVWTDQDRLVVCDPEHCRFTGGEAIYKGINISKITMETPIGLTAFSFVGQGEAATLTAGAADNITYAFSSQYNGYYDGDFRYDEASGKYRKWQFGTAQLDAGTGEQLAFDNVFLLYADIGFREGTELIQVDFEAGGVGYYFSKGEYEQITWEKPNYSANFVFYNAAGEELKVNTGKTHIGVVNNNLADRLEITAN